jgi:type 2 lantibiotic biosynthesis protein LanM
MRPSGRIKPGHLMESEYERLVGRAVTIDELLSDAYQPLPGQKGDAELAGRRLAAWCRASASGDWSLFTRRLQRDGLSIQDVLARFATVRRSGAVPAPSWMADARWVGAALHRSGDPEDRDACSAGVAFEDLLAPLVQDARAHLLVHLDPRLLDTMTDGAFADICTALLMDLSDLASPALYERFAEARGLGTGYREFVAHMRADGFHRLFEDKPVLLRLITSLTRQWIDTSHELINRLASDLPSIRGELLGSARPCRVASIKGNLSDPHNFGRTVRILGFEDGTRVVYKPKDLAVDAAWAALIDRLNDNGPPVDLRAARVLAAQNYGWTEFIDHTSCDGEQDIPLFFRRAGAWLALFQVFVGVDMHQENIAATGAHPVPIDLEMILQQADIRTDLAAADDSGLAFIAAMKTVIDSVITIGLLPAYGRHSTSEVFVIGGVNSNSSPRMAVRWAAVNTDAMEPLRERIAATITNLPHVDGSRGRLGDHIDELIAGFGAYAEFLQTQRPQDLLDGFAGMAIRTVIRPTRFYGGLLARMRDHRTMNDGVMWSAQADFTVRLADWENEPDPMWPLQRAERSAVLELNVPHFTTVSDGNVIRDATGLSIRATGTPGLDRAATRLRGLSDDEIAWQVDVIRHSTDLLRPQPTTTRGLLAVAGGSANLGQAFTDEAGAIAGGLSAHAVREGRGAAWIGLDWLGDSEVSQLVVLGPDLYNGACGIALFLAAHAAVTGDESSASLSRAALAGLRRALHGRNPARTARSIGLGGGLGLGSIVYGLAVIADLLDDGDILADAGAAAQLITDDIIAADRQLDVLGGSAGAILGLLRLYRQTGSQDALMLAEKCGQWLLSRERAGQPGRRTWVASAFGRPLNGMSHGAAGYAYSMTALACATGNHEFLSAANECLAFEESTYDAQMYGWADLRDIPGSGWPCKWCYGAPGIGLARIAMMKLAEASQESCVTDIDRALRGVEHGWPAATDTLCCGTLGSIELLREAGDLLGRRDLRERADRQLSTVVETARASGDYGWSSGTDRFNIGLFRGIAGVGYTLLRGADTSLPNVLVWE